MPNALIHRCVNKKVLERINKYKTEEEKYLYDVAAIAPDSWRNTKRFKESQLPKKLKRMHSHFSLETEFIEHYEIFQKKYKDYLDNPFIFGYLIHLMTDNFWRTEMYEKSIVDEEHGNILNHDLEILTQEISNYYNINELKELTEKQIEFLPKIDEMTYEGINDTIRFTNNQLLTKTSGQIKKYVLDDIVKGIEICAQKIIEEIGDL